MNALPESIRALLAVVVEALDVPLADEVADDDTAARLLRQRASDCRIIARSVLTAYDTEGIECATAQLRGWTAERPVTYRSWQDRTDVPAENGGETPVFEVEQSGADSSGWDPDDPHGDVDEYERGEHR